jgi:UPF0716 protein FxsA
MRARQIFTWFLLIWVALEIAGFIWVGELIGAGWTILLIIGGMIIGMSLLRSEGMKAANKLMTKVRSGQKPSPEEVMQTPFLMFGAVLLIIPGFLSDIIGVLCFLPPFRRMLTAVMLKNMPKQPKSSQAKPEAEIHQGRTFEGEFHEDDKS